MEKLNKKEKMKLGLQTCKNEKRTYGIHRNSVVSPGGSNFVLFWLVIRGRTERDVAVKRSKRSQRKRDKRTRTRTRVRRRTRMRKTKRERDDGGTGMEIKKNPTIISPAKNATTYVEDGTGTLEQEG